MKPARPRRTPANLSAPVHRRLNAYALAASAAGVSLLALGRPSEAEIVYTPTDATVSRGHSSYNLDLNNDGITDFTIVEFAAVRSSHDSSQIVFVSAPQGNHVQCIPYNCYSSNSYVAVALKAGSSIDGHGPWIVNPNALMARRSANDVGTFYGFSWPNVRDRYLGLKFRIHGEVHFGWARLSVEFHTGAQERTWQAHLTGYAYETIPNKSIPAGKTGGYDDAAALPSPMQVAPLGALALGADGIALWRRENPHP